jgi:hypothetical protein
VVVSLISTIEFGSGRVTLDNIVMVGLTDWCHLCSKASWRVWTFERREATASTPPCKSHVWPVRLRLYNFSQSNSRGWHLLPQIGKEDLSLFLVYSPDLDPVLSFFFVFLDLIIWAGQGKR